MDCGGSNEAKDQYHRACLMNEQRQARLETKMRSFPVVASPSEDHQDKPDLKRKRASLEDPLSHRVIEKRRRDRMNSCLADLSRLIPSASYAKKGRGRIEKTEIIEMAIKHMKHLQSLAGQESGAVPCDPGGMSAAGVKPGEAADYSKGVEATDFAAQIKVGGAYRESFRHGYRECMTEALHYLEGRGELSFHSDHNFSARFINHLNNHCDSLTKESKVVSHRRKKTIWSDTSTVNSAEDKSERGEDTVKSDISEESGYSSLKQEELFKDFKYANINKEHFKDFKYAADNNKQESAEFHRRKKFASESSVSSLTNSQDVERIKKDRASLDYELQGSSRRKSGGDYAQRLAEGFSVAALSEYSAHEVNIQESSREEKSSSPEQPTDLSIKSDRDLQEMHQTNLYKFKSNIRQRFSLQDNIAEPTEAQPLSTFSEMADEGNASSELRAAAAAGFIRKSFAAAQPKYTVPHDFSRHQPTLSALKTEDNSQDCLSFSAATAGQPPPLKSSGTPVPIFALNSAGSYYVPMTVDVSVIGPFIHLYREKECSVLHPVTISVNFQSSHVTGEPSSSTTRSGVIQQPSVIKRWRDQKWNL